jgi:3'-phosphoadenosine 5'-phosphosulfate sulfotransferase
LPGVHYIDVGTTPNANAVKARFRIRAENGCLYAVRHESRKSMVEEAYDTYFWIENTTRKVPVTDKVAGSLY